MIFQTEFSLVSRILQSKMAIDKSYSDENYFFKLQKIPLKFVGFWPGDERTKISGVALALFNSMLILLTVGFEFNFVYIHSDNLGSV
jgi:hypothetical protein